jgi:DNA polymerase-1
MTMQVHDELVFEVPDGEKEEASALVRDRMENVCRLAVPLTVDLSLGRNWLEAK